METAFQENLLAGSVVQTESLAEWYHENTKLYAGSEPSVGRDPGDPVAEANRLCLEQQLAETSEFVALHGKSYATADVIPLPRPTLQATLPLKQALEQRRSETRFVPSGAIDLARLSTLLHYGYGLNEERCSPGVVRRHVPSAGALFPLELYLAALRLEGHEPGSLFHYRARGHCLEYLGAVGGREGVRALFTQPAVADAAAVIFIAGCLPRLAWKYGERSYRYLLLEAGHVGQNLCLVSSALGLAACPVVGFYDDAVHDLFLLDGVSEFMVYAVGVGAQAQKVGEHPGHRKEVLR